MAHPSIISQAMGRPHVAEVDDLGDWLGWNGPDLVCVQSAALSDAERANLENNRAAAAREAWDWLQGMGGIGAFETVEVQAEDGARLVGHALVCNPGSDLWLVYAHGLHGTWKSGMNYAVRAASAGCNLLFIEMRAHGASGGAWIGASWLERRDLVCWCRWVVARAGEGVRIVLAGSSLGAASCLMACGEKGLPPQVKACISDSAFSDWLGVSVHLIESGALGVRPMKAHPLLDLLRLRFMFKKGGYDIARARPVDAIARSKVPVLLIHAEKDQTAPVEMAHRLDAAAGGAAAGEGHQLLVVPSCGHCCALFADLAAYWGAVFGFLGRWL